MEKQTWHAVNLKQVTDLLTEMNCHELATVKGPSKKGGKLTFWGLQGAVMIVQEYAEDSGLEVFRLFVPASRSIKMDDVLTSVREYIDEARGDKKHQYYPEART